MTTESQGPETAGIYWLSFVDPQLPKGERFLGVSIVRAASAINAAEVAWELGCNPGGEVLINGPMPEGIYMPEDMCRLLNADDARRLAVVEPGQPYVEITDRMARCPQCNATDWVTNFQAGRHDHSPARS